MPLKRLTKPRFLFVYPLAVWLFFVARITDSSLRIGVIFIAMGQWLRLWANGYVGHVKVNVTQPWRGDQKIGRLITGGPYAFVRHPLYLGTLLIGAGYSIAVGSVWFGALALIGFFVTYRAKMAKEDELLRDECGPAYAAYRASVPAIIPAFRRYPRREGRWSWKGVAASKEWKTVIWNAVVVIAIYFWEEIRQEHQPLLGQHRLLRMGLIGIVVVLVMTDVVFELVQRSKKSLTPST